MTTMKAAPSYEILKPARVELRVGHRVIERSYQPGDAGAETDDDRLALEHLCQLGAARLKPTPKPAKRPAPKED